MKTIVTPVTNTNNLTTGVRNTAGFSSNNFGTVQSFSAGNLSPLFNTSVTLPNSTPALSFTALMQNANLLFAGPGSGSAAAPAFRALVGADFPATTIPIAAINATGTPSATTFLRGDGTWSSAPVTTVAGRTGAITLAAGDISGLAASATTDTTNAANISSGTLAAARLPGFTGDATSAAGASALTLATVNSSPGTFGSATQSLSATVNAKGLVTALSAQTITPAWSSITATPTTLAGYGVSSPLPISQGGTAAATSAAAATSLGLGTSSNVVFGSISSPGAYLYSERFGLGASVTGMEALAAGNSSLATYQSISLGYNVRDVGTGGNILIGYSSSASSNANYAIAIGYMARASQQGTAIGGFSAPGPGGYPVAIGYSSTITSGDYSTVIGGFSSVSNNGTIIGCRATSTGGIAIGYNSSAASGQFSVGSLAYQTTDVSFGSGFSSNPPIDYFIHGTNGSVAGNTGGNIYIAGGLGGSAADAGGNVYLSTSAAGAGTTRVVRVTVASTGAVTIPGTLALGGGTPVKAIRTASVTLAFPSIAAGGGTQSLTTTITGAAVGDTVIVNRADGSMPDAGTLLDAAVTSANTVTIRDTNITSAAITPISTTYRITVISY